MGQGLGFMIRGVEFRIQGPFHESCTPTCGEVSQPSSLVGRVCGQDLSSQFALVCAGLPVMNLSSQFPVLCAGFAVMNLSSQVALLCAGRAVMVDWPLPSDKGTTSEVSRTLTYKPRPESGLYCLICAMFARQRSVASRV